MTCRNVADDIVRFGIYGAPQVSLYTVHITDKLLIMCVSRMHYCRHGQLFRPVRFPQKVLDNTSPSRLILST